MWTDLHLPSSAGIYCWIWTLQLTMNEIKWNFNDLGSSRRCSDKLNYLWPKIIQIIEIARIPLRQSIALFDLLLDMSNSFEPLVYAENEIIRALGVSESINHEVCCEHYIAFPPSLYTMKTSYDVLATRRNIATPKTHLKRKNKRKQIN